MVTGHFATALVPYELLRRRGGPPFWVFLLASQCLDFLMLGLVMAGVETLTPVHVIDLSFAGMRADMLVSHDLVPVLGWGLAFGATVWAVTRHRLAAWWCVALVWGHEVCDWLVGFKHGVMMEPDPMLGANLYNRAPVAGLLIEAALSAAAVWWFVHRRAQAGQPVSPRGQWALGAILVGGALMSIPLAHQSLRAWVGA